MESEAGRAVQVLLVPPSMFITAWLSISVEMYTCYGLWSASFTVSCFVQ